MKKILLILSFLILFFFQGKRQIYNIHNFYTQNLFFYSPAHTGDKGQFAAFIGYRDHLSSLDNATQTGVVGFHSPIMTKMNLGTLIKTERIGLFETLSGRLDCAFRTPIANGHILSFGINGGVMQRNLNYENAIVFDLNDPTLSPDYLRSYVAFAGAAVNYQYKNLNFDFGVPVLYKSQDLIYTNYWSFLSYSFFSKTKKWMIQPSAALNYNAGKQLGYQANLMFNYDNVFWFQPTYKANNSLAFSVGVNLKKTGIAYAYETNSGALSSIGGASHELMISYGFFKARDKLADTIAIDDPENRLKRKIGDKTYEEYVSSNNYGFYNSIVNLTDSMHKEEVRRKEEARRTDSVKTVARIDSLERARIDSLERVRKDSIRTYTLRHLSGEELKILEKGVHFELGSAMVTGDSRNYLNEVAELIKANKNIKVLISGHTCDIGSDNINLRFSMDRADAVKFYLVIKGVDPVRVSTNAKLDAEPVVPNINEENRQLNRRVSFSIIRE